MKLLIIMPYSNNPAGGVETVAYNTIQGFLKISDLLERENIVLEVLSYKGNKISKPKIEQYNDKIKIFYLKRTSHVTSLGELQALLHSLKIKPRNYDIILSHDIYSLIIGIFSKVPTFFTMHGIPWKEKIFTDKLSSKIHYTLESYRFMLYFRFLSGFIAISKYVIEELNKMKFIGKKSDVLIELIENPVGEDFFNIKKNEDEIIFCPAVVTPRKNQLSLLKAVKILKDNGYQPKIVLTGSIRDLDYFKALKNFIEDNDLNNVTILGKVPYQKILNIYSQSLFLVLPSYQETLPMVIAESMATGTPPVASSIDSVKYMIENYRTGILVNPRDPADIADKMMTLLDDNNLRRKLAINAKKTAERRWKAESVVMRLIEFLIKYQSNF